MFNAPEDNVGDAFYPNPFTDARGLPSGEELSLLTAARFSTRSAGGARSGGEVNVTLNKHCDWQHREIAGLSEADANG